MCRLCMGATLRSWLMPIFLWLMAFIINSISNWVNFPGGRGGNSLWWPIQGGCARKGYFFQASGISKGRGFTNRSIQKGREMSFGSVKGPKRANRLIYGFKKSRKSFVTLQLQQLKGIQSSKRGMCKAYHLSKEGIWKGYLFREKWYING